MDRCHYLTVDGQDVICAAVNPPVILGDIMGYSGFTCSVCKQKFGELKKKQDSDRKRETKTRLNIYKNRPCT